MFHLDVACFHLDVAYVAVAIRVCCKFMFQMFYLIQTYVASVLSECCICCSGYTHMLQAYVLICFTMFSECVQQVLLPTRCMHLANRPAPTVGRVRNGSQ
jgi:hypothetical protein